MLLPGRYVDSLEMMEVWYLLQGSNLHKVAAKVTSEEVTKDLFLSIPLRRQSGGESRFLKAVSHPITGSSPLSLSATPQFFKWSLRV